ncbi:MAG: hypothetical protein PHS61_06285 [Candidatus Omnitrophica bacterium]|nr:hypothetical protein [Candidatus Omnitrophota bacterium]
MPKIKYEIDPHNRLIETGGGLRRVLDGTFKTDGGHALAYRLKKPAAQGGFQQVKFSGTWGLDKDNNLVFSLDKWGRQIAGNKLILKTGVLSVSGHEVVFSVESRDADGGTQVSLLKLEGAWQVDRSNRLNFLVQRQGVSPDRLKFQGTWQVNKNHELEYRFSGSARAGNRHIIGFKGTWAFGEGGKLSYDLEGEPGKSIELRASLERAFSNKLVFVLGAGAAPQKNKLVFFGTWRFLKGPSLSFELTRKDGRISRIAFGVRARLSKNSCIEMALTNTAGDGLGVKVVLSKEMSGGEAFLRFVREAGGSAVLVGFGKQW